MKLITLSTPKEVEPFLPSSLYQGFDVESLSTYQSDSHCVLLEDDEPAARCSLWWTKTPLYNTERVGLIGHYAPRSDEAARELLNQICQMLAAKGCTLIIGPMDGSTWRRYRFVTDNSLNAPPFLLEPTNSPSYPKQWLSCDFEPLAQYTSTLQTSLEPDPSVTERLEKLVNTRLAKVGITFRSLDKSNIEGELESIFDISLKSFADNFLYTPISKEEFVKDYQKVLPFAVSELVVFAELNEQPIGYVFGIPDVLQKQRGETLDTFIIKTLAVLPEHTNKGLGTVLVNLVVRKARELGFKKAIHALMLETNQSQTISERFQSQLLRRYTLYAKRLQ
jgi:GNAT superfamily N-acetyltransferase